VPASGSSRRLAGSRRIAVGFPAPVPRRTALIRAAALAVTLGGLGAAGPFSSAPQRLDASINPSGIQFGISPFLAVRPQTYGTGVQFQMPPGVSVIPAGITPSSSAAPRSTAVARPSHGRNGPGTCRPLPGHVMRGVRATGAQ